MSQHYGTEPVNFTITFERQGNLNSSKHYIKNPEGFW